MNEPNIPTAAPEHVQPEYGLRQVPHQKTLPTLPFLNLRPAITRTVSPTWIFMACIRFVRPSNRDLPSVFQ